MYVHLITHSTLYAICHINYQRLAARRVHSTTSKSNSICNSEVVRGCESCRGQTTFSLPRVVPKFHLLGVTLIGVYGLNLPEVGKLLVPSILVKFSHMDSRLKSDTTFNWTCIIPLSQHFTPTKKKKKTVQHERYPGEIMVTKISSTAYWISSQWELWRETPYEICVCLFFITRLLCLQNFKTDFSLYGLPLVSVMCSCRK